MTDWITEGPNGMGANPSTNGYTVLPGGTIMQWGRLPGNHDGAWHNFPTPFPNVCFNVVVTPHASAMNNDYENPHIGEIRRDMFWAKAKYDHQLNNATFIAFGR